MNYDATVRKSERAAVTLVEVLIVIAIIGLLVQLILPAVQGSREAARRTQCANNLKQLGTACLLHEETHGRFPCGGWGTSWAPDPDEGNDDKQPGGWTYNVLPYLEQNALHSLGQGAEDHAQRLAIEELLATPVDVFYCPSRRAPRAYPAENILVHHYDDAEPLMDQARTDYAANSGDFFTGFWAGNPDNREMGPWIDEKINNENYTGVIYHRSLVEPRHIVDGLSNTFLVGEKAWKRNKKILSDDAGDAHTMYAGASWQNCRWTRVAPSTAPYGPVADSAPAEEYDAGKFGSAHANGCSFALCDGSISTVAYDVDPDVFRWMGNRKDSGGRYEYTNTGYADEEQPSG